MLQKFILVLRAGILAAPKVALKIIQTNHVPADIITTRVRGIVGCFEKPHELVS